MEMRNGAGSPSGAARQNANGSFKAQDRAWFWGGISAAVVVHFGVLAFGPSFAVVLDVSAPPAELYSVELVPPPDVVEPEPPPAVTRPAPPEEAIPPRPTRLAQPVPVELEGERGLDAFAFDEIPEIPPLPAPPAKPEAEDDPRHVVFTVAPELVNRERIRSILQRRYPARLRNAGIQGTVLLQLWIDENGEVTRHAVARSSGNEELDRIAQEVIDLMEFRPAYNLGKPVAVSVALPIVFEVR